MSVKAYRLGYRHGLDGIRHMAHRKMRQYDSRSYQTAYNNGYRKGYAERLAKGKTLDYGRKENNQLFD